MSTGKVIAGFLCAGAIGVGGGYGLSAVADTMAESSPQIAAPAIPQIPDVKVERVEGIAAVIGEGGAWHRAHAGESVPRPTGLRTEGMLTGVTVSAGPYKVTAQKDTEVFISAHGRGLDLQLDRGHVIIMGAAPSTTRVPTAELTVKGTAYGVWSLDDELRVAVIAGELELQYKSKKPTTFAKGREIIFRRGSMTPRALEPKLKLLRDRVSGKALQGRTSPSALLFVKRGSRYEPVRLSGKGTFSTVVSARRPSPGELVVFDASGRNAEIASPSRSLEELAAGAARARPAPPPPGGETAAPPPKEAPPKRAPPPPRASTGSNLKKVNVKAKPTRKAPTARDTSGPSKKAAPPPPKKTAPPPPKKAAPPPPKKVEDIPEDFVEDDDEEIDTSRL